jgi:hypothetical protein
MKAARDVITKAEEIQRKQGSESALAFITAAKANTPGLAFKPVLECAPDLMLELYLIMSSRRQHQSSMKLLACIAVRAAVVGIAWQS